MELVTIRVSREALESLKELVSDMEEFINDALDDFGIPVDGYRELDEGMSAWNEDVARAAQDLLATIQ